MKKFYLAFCLIFIGYSGYSQYQIDFDSFTLGDISGQSTNIIPWPGATSSPQITSSQSFSVSNSMQVRNNVTDDVVFQLGNKTSGSWVVEFMMYVPSNNVGYWNIQENESTLPNQWNADFYVGTTANGGATGLITHDQSTTTVSYPSGSWFSVEMNIDLDNSTLSTTIDGSVLLNTVLYPGSQLGGINFYSVDVNNNYFIDDFKLYEFCYVPSNVSVTNITTTTADFSWTGTSTETNGYSWVIVNAGDDPLTATPVQTGTTATGVTNVSISNLTPESDYDFYVLGDCGVNGNSDLSSALNFQTPTTCLAPSNLNLVTTSDTTVEVSWTISPDEMNGYEWFIFITGADPDTDTPVLSGVTSTGDSSVSISNLTSNTTYDFYLSADCSTDGVSKLEGPLTFTTLCSPLASFPFTEDFESTSNTLACWSQIQEDGTADWTFEEGSSDGNITTAYSGIQNARFVSVQGINTPITKLVSPILDLSTLNNPTLSFYYGQENYVGDQNEMKVYYRESSTDSWVEIAHYTSSVDDWTQEVLALPNPSSTYQIAFEGINYFGRANVLDDVLIEDNLALHSNNVETFNYYPNPAQSSMTFSGKSVIKNIQFIDILGKEVMNVFPNKTEINLNVDHLKSGIYFVNVNIGNTNKTVKIVKK